MSETFQLTIGNETRSLVIKEYNGQRVVTFKDIDEQHQRPSGTAGRNFRENRNRFIENTDYFLVKLTDDEIRRQFGVNKHAKEIILITESGYSMLTKPFTDDLAWSVQRQLVNGYFRAKEIAVDSKAFQMIAQAVTQPLLQSINDLKRNQQALNNLVSYLAHQVINPETKTSANLNDTKSALNQPYRGKYDQETLDIAFLREEACQSIIAARNDRFIFKKDLGMIERAWAEQLGLNSKYLFKLVKQYETEGFSALLPKERRDKGGRKSVCLAGSALIKDLHCAEPNPVVMATYTKALQEAQELGPDFCNYCGFAENCQQTDRAGIKIGSHNTVYRLINVELPAEEIDQWRSGLEEYRRKSQASKRF